MKNIYIYNYRLWKMRSNTYKKSALSVNFGTKNYKKLKQTERERKREWRKKKGRKRIENIYQ